MTERCVSCNRDTKYFTEDHIDQRLGYVQGAGQLCLSCFDEIYIKPIMKETKKLGEKNEQVLKSDG